MRPQAKRPRISIVTPTRHAPHLMDRLFDSLLRQTCGDFEHVLVDTSSDSRTQERWWRDFAPRLGPRFRYARVPLPAPDMAGAFEYAFDQARGDYVCPMTHKAMWRPDAVENFVRILDAYPGLPCFSFKSLYVDYDIHALQGDPPTLPTCEFGTAWDGAMPNMVANRDTFIESATIFADSGYSNEYSLSHMRMPFSSHTMYSATLLKRVRARYGALVAGRFAGDARLGYRVMDLVDEVPLFLDFEPRCSSMLESTGAAGSQLTSWTYLRQVFETLSAETKQVISRSPFGYLPLWSVLTYWELFSVVTEARGNLQLSLEFRGEHIGRVLTREIDLLTDIDEPLRAGLKAHVDAIIARIDGGILRCWF